MAESYGLKAKRAWGSDGRSMGLHKDVDVLIEDTIKIQVKKRKKFPDWIGISDYVDYNVIQTDYKPPMIIIPLDEYLQLIKERDNVRST